LRERATRDELGLFVAEGPRAVAAAFDHGAPVQSLYVAGACALSERAEAAAIPVVQLPSGWADRIGVTRTPQPVFATVTKPQVGLDAFATASLVVVGPQLSDPGNLGTLMRSAGAAGATVIGIGPGSVDAYNPKVVRASAGACFAIRTVEGVPAVEMLETLGALGFRRIGAVGSGGRLPEQLDLCGRVALVVGNEAHGLDAELPLDELTTIPMHAGESLNVAMAGTTLLFEAARQRRAVTR
jgi:RNA methyltransferase, TrmH family